MKNRRMICMLLIICLCIGGFMPCAMADTTSLLESNFDGYTSGVGTAPSGWTPSSTDQSGYVTQYEYGSAATDRGRSVKFTQYSTYNQAKLNSISLSTPSGPFAFEISVKRNALLSTFNISLRAQSGTGSAHEIVLDANGSIKFRGDSIVGAGWYEANKWVDVKFVVMPETSKYTVVVHQGDKYAAKTGNLSNVPSLRDIQIYFPGMAGAASTPYADGNTVYLDDIKLYTCDALVIPASAGSMGDFAQTDSSPRNGQANVQTDSKVNIWFNEEVINTDMTDVWYINGESIDAGRVTLSTDAKCATVDLNGLLSLDTAYTLSYSGITNADMESLSGAVAFTTAKNKYSLAEVNPVFDDETDTYSLNLGGKSNNGENQNIKAVFTFHDASGTLKGVQIEDISLASSWAEAPVTVNVPIGTALGEVYFWDSLEDMNVMEEKKALMGESTAAAEYSGSKELDYSIDYAQSKLSLSGKGAVGKVSIIVLKPSHSSTELSGTNDEAEAAIDYITQSDCTENGTFSVSHVLGGGEGEYTVLVNRHDGNGAEEHTGFIFYMTQESINSAVESFNDDAADYATLIPNTARAFNMDLSHYNSLVNPTLKGKEKVHAAVKAARPYTLPSQIRTVVEKNSVLHAINEAESETALHNLLWNNVAVLEIDKASLYSTYVYYKDRITDSLDSKLFKADYATPELLTEAFNDNTILCAIAAGELYTEVKTVMESSFEYLGWDLTQYNLLNESKSVFSSIKGQSYDTVELLHTAFDEAVEKQRNAELEKKEPSNSGGGGGGGGGKTITIKDPEKLEQEEEPELPKEEETQESEIKFTDTATHPWAEEAVNALAKAGILNGREEGKFYPADALKREEMVKCLVCAFDDVLSSDGEAAQFTDTDKNAWYMSYIEKAYKNGIVNGTGENSFGIGTQISRQDLAVMCVRAAQKAGIQFSLETEPDFSDAQTIAPYAQEAVSMLYNAGIMIGDENRAFRPSAMATRAEAAKILYMILQKGMMI